MSETNDPSTIALGKPNRNGDATVLYAIVCITPEGDEGICGARCAYGWTPLICSDWRVVEQSLIPAGRVVAANSPGNRVMLRKFEQATDVQELSAL
jgi:hypothetical protein